ncbi:MAG: DUF58 domain-containing protein [Frankiaceae bacterium]
MTADPAAEPVPEADPAPAPTERSMLTVSTKVTTYAVLAVVMIGLALAIRRPELVALGAPFAVALVTGLVLHRRPSLAVTTAISADRIIEGEELELVVTLASDVTIGRVELIWPLPAGLHHDDAVTMPHAVRLRAGERRELRYPIRTARWGVYRLGSGFVRVRGPLGLSTYEQFVEATHVVRVYPATETLRHLARPAETTLTVGTLLARRLGDGAEHADIRPFVTGDRVRNVNWRATARRGDLWVNDHHPERSTDVVVLVDAFGGIALTASVRAAVSLATGYLRERDRVGVVSFGAMLRWLRLGFGQRQLYRIIDALIESAALYSHAWKALDHLPPQALPTNAILVAVTPLTDRRTVTALLDRAARGTEVAVVQVSLEPYATGSRSAAERLGRAMWRLEVQRTADHLRERGIPVVPWHEDGPLDATLEEVAAFQRYARHQVG